MAAETQKPKRWGRRILFGAFFAFLFVNVVIAGILAWLTTGVAELDGEIADLSGLEAEATIARDESGLLWITAQSPGDASFALGYAHAQDRLYQMEMTRRIGAGMLHEVLGEAGLGYDKLLRTLGLYGLAERNYDRLSGPARAHLDAYAAGVNAFIETRPGALPPEFLIPGLDFRPWVPADSLVWGRLMALQLSGNWFSEITRARMLKAGLTAEDLELLYAPFPGEERAKLGPDLSHMLRGVSDSLLAALPAAAHPAIRPRLASNAWALAGSRTPTGKPVLAGDPHLGFQTPNLWSLARVEAPGYTRVGAFVPGVPFLLIGHNGRVAWSMTTTHSDTQDLFIETVDPADATRYRTPDGWAPFETRVETFELGGETIEHPVRRTRHGPVISDVRPEAAAASEPGTVLALASPVLAEDDGTAQALHDMGAATDADAFIRALEVFHAPQQNVVFADTDGTIGVISAGRVPIRRSGSGFLPSPGGGSHDWLGWAEFEDLPGTIDPEGGAVANANNHVTGRDPNLFVSAEFDAPYRYQRIVELLAESDGTAGSMTAIQHDTVSPFARAMLRHMLPAIDPDAEADPVVASAARRLQRWDGDMDRDASEPLIFAAWIRRLQERLFADELGPLADEYRRPRAATLIRVLATEHPWCDDRDSAPVESCDEIVRAALVDAMGDVVRLFGPGNWRWGDAHVAKFRHQIWSRIPWLGERMYAKSETGGGDYTVSRGSWRGPDDDPFRHVHGAGLRVVYDLADLDRSLFSAAVGASANILDPRYTSWQADWAAGRYRTLPAIPDTLAHQLVLRP